MNAATIEEKVLNYIQDNNLIYMGDTVSVAVSGGIDSITLLTFLDKYKEKLGISLWAIHVNHGIRGETANRDMAFVHGLCSDRKIPCFVFNAYEQNIEVPENASEEWARNLRYSYFEQISKQHNCRVAIAHSISDQAETFIFRTMRGVGLRGLAGIKPQRDQYIRPFLCITRKEVEILFESYGIEHINDETNDTDAYARNKIRHKIIPEMQEINPNTLTSISRICTQLGKVEEYICKQAKALALKAWLHEEDVYSVDILQEADPVVREQFICDLLSKHVTITESLVSLINSQIEGTYCPEEFSDGEHEELTTAISIAENITLYITNVYVSLVINAESVKLTKEDIFDMSETSVDTIPFGNLGYNISISKNDRQKFIRETLDIRQLAHYTSLDNLIKLAPLTVRPWKPGDRFKPACKVERKVKAIFKELSIPLANRSNIPVITDKTGRIIWVWGMGFTDGMLGASPKDQDYMYKFS